jgi:hypothetical protein
VRTNFKVGLYISVLIFIGAVTIGTAFGFKSAQDEDIFFVLKIAAIVGAVISIVGLKATDGSRH